MTTPTPDIAERLGWAIIDALSADDHPHAELCRDALAEINRLRNLDRLRSERLPTPFPRDRLSPAPQQRARVRSGVGPFECEP